MYDLKMPNIQLSMFNFQIGAHMNIDVLRIDC